MAKKTDALTRWWRGISLRAKVTGVIVAVLAIGLAATGVGTMVFLREALVQNLDSQLEQLQQTDVASNLFEIEVGPDAMVIRAREDASPTDYFVALYGPNADADGAFLLSAGGSGGPAPDFPSSFTLQDTYKLQNQAFFLEDVETGTQFRAMVSALPIGSTATFATQLIAVPLTSVNRVVTTFLGIFGLLALITLVAAALLTRLVVTLTFRSLGQVESTAMAIAGGDLTQRMTDTEPGTEVGKLKLALNTMLNRVDGALA
ncbi:MAG: HAMP domain-containing protein, partial [Candidatus Cloacimonetes bacterium]|nr:HAMP domain-containing protein [Candidatus Cloacimonadota bacterium]